MFYLRPFLGGRWFWKSAVACARFLTATVVVLVKSGVDDSGADENVMGKDANDVSDVALTADGLGGVIAARNKIMITK